MFSSGKRLKLLIMFVAVVMLSTPKNGAYGYVFRRFHQESEARHNVARELYSNSSVPYDTIGLENYLRNYLHGPQNSRYVYSNHDVIAAYAGPRMPNTRKSSVIRAWAMFDKKTRSYCNVVGVFEYGELALFSCKTPGLYQAHAIEMDSTLKSEAAPTQVDFVNKRVVYKWHTRTQKESFSLLTGDEKQFPVFSQSNAASNTFLSADEKMHLILSWETSISNMSTTPGVGGTKVTVVTSDPVLIKGSHFCYYWMYHLTELARPGYVESQLLPDEDNPTNTYYHKKSAYILYALDIWIAEPSAVGYKETEDETDKIQVSQYSKVITNRFYTTGLFPCLRKAHSVVEIVQDIKYYKETDLSGTALSGTPHWTAIIKVHTDRLISELSDVTFTIASRQNTGSFHCFVGDTRVFINLRNFDFVPIRKLNEDSVNLLFSNVYPEAKLNIKFHLDHVYGHGVHYIGHKKPKRFQPASTRTDMIIFENPCIVQEFAISVGGSMYIAEGLLSLGPKQAKKVALPYFPDSRKINNTGPTPETQDFVRIYDVAFTPTHAAFLMAEGYVILHSTSAKLKGIADIKETMKYRPDAFAKRRWCARTATPKLSGMILPIFSDEGNIIILQVYPIEGNVRIWNTNPPASCKDEGRGFVKKADPRESVINETDIHYQDFAKVKRTNHKTGLLEPPPPERPAPPTPPKPDLQRELVYLLDSEKNWVADGKDAHFPPEVINPASQVIGGNFKDYNQALIYVVEDSQDTHKQGLLRILLNNGLTTSEIHLSALEFTSAEKTFVYALVFQADEIPQSYSAGISSTAKPYQMMISTLTITNFPYRVKILTELDSLDNNVTDERLDYVSPFPGALLIRTKPYRVKVEKSRDQIEDQENTNSLRGDTEVEFVPQIFTLGTSIPSYVINLGDVIVHTSVENRYAKPIHYFPWDIVDERYRSAGAFDDPKPITFNDSDTKFEKEGTLYDLVVTEQGIISVLWRKKVRHLITHDENCLHTPDSSEPQTIALGSAIVQSLREVKPFFRNDNIFQRGTPDGEIVYGVYNVKPYSSFATCREHYNETQDDEEPCVDQELNMGNSTELVEVCTFENAGFGKPCRDPGYLHYCNATPQVPFEACLRNNKACPSKPIYEEPYNNPGPFNATVATRANCSIQANKSHTCFPKHAPREEISTVDVVGTSYQSYLLGSLQAVKSIHPESLDWEDEVSKLEPNICPFASFELFHVEVDFAEVGYQTRITGEVSYYGSGIPTEADLIVEYEQSIGIIVSLSSSVEENRHLTTIRKTVDIYFEMTDYTLYSMMNVNPHEKHLQRQKNFDFQDVRAREPFSVFSITLRPTIINLHCTSTDFFKTVQYNIGCNAYSTMRLLSEATSLKRVDWEEVLTENSGFKWLRNDTTWNLTLPREHIYYQQLKKGVFTCYPGSRHCQIPYYHLFKNNIFTISYRDLLLPKFEQFLTISSRRVTANMVLYDMLGSKEFNWTVNKLDAGCVNTEHFWYDEVLAGTKVINNETFENENLYIYYKDCFSSDPRQGEKENSQNLYVSPFYFFNQTNNNMIKFLRKRNQIIIFRAVAMNTYYNRFTYCKQLDTFFMIRVTGIPIPRQGLEWWLYISIFLSVLVALIVSYVFFSKFYSGIASTTK